MLGNLIGGFITILIGATLAPTVADEIKSAQLGGGNGSGDNVTGAADIILGLTTLFYALAVCASGIAIVTIALKRAGILGM